jgi:hypothetical protein
MKNEIGRPPLNNIAMTPAQRKAKQRYKDKRNQIDAIGFEDQANLKSLISLMNRVELSPDAKSSAHSAWLAFGNKYFRDSHEM